MHAIVSTPALALLHAHLRLDQRSEVVRQEDSTPLGFKSQPRVTHFGLAKQIQISKAEPTEQPNLQATNDACVLVSKLRLDTEERRVHFLVQRRKASSQACEMFLQRPLDEKADRGLHDPHRWPATTQRLQIAERSGSIADYPVKRNLFPASGWASALRVMPEVNDIKSRGVLPSSANDTHQRVGASDIGFKIDPTADSVACDGSHV